MSDREHRDVTFEANEYDVIREVVDRKAAYVTVHNTRNEGSRLRKLLQVLKRLSDLCGESVRDLTAPFAVPGSCFAQFVTCVFP